MEKDDGCYRGPKKACDQCGAPFLDGKLVIVCIDKDGALCSRGETKTEQALCAINWARKNGATDEKMFNFKCLVYQGG